MSRSGRFIEAIGVYNPMVNPMIIEVKEDRLMLWLRRGAQPSDTLRSLLQRKGLWLKWGMMKKGSDEATIAAAFEKWQSLQAERQQRDAERKSRRKATRKAKAAKAAEAPPAAPPAPAPPAEPAPATPAA